VIAKIKDRGNGATFFAEFYKVSYKPLTGKRNQKSINLMKILLLNPPARQHQYRSIVIPPLGLMYVGVGEKDATASTR
jgi:glucose/arabinose dehydrogenase